MDQFVVDRMFEGFPGVTHGGYLAGLASRTLDRSAVVTLTRSVAPGSLVSVDTSESEIRLRVDGELVATARSWDFDETAPEPVTLREAEAAAEGYLGFAHHFFPSCFCCGPARAVNEGLRIFTGTLEGRPIVAAPWQPPPLAAAADGSVAHEFVWAALDCPAIWGALVHGNCEPDDRAVSAQLATRLLAPVPADQPSIVVGWPLGRDGRKIFAGAAIFSGAGDLLAEARQTMIVTARGVPMNLAAWVT